MRLGPRAQLRGPWGFLLALFLDSECRRAGPYELLVTHGGDGWHSRKSLHYDDLAVDGIVVGLDGQVAPLEVQRQVQQSAAEALRGHSQDFDVLLEDPGGPNMHLHVERDLKGPVRL